jgi:hypothetical protein
VVIDSRTSETFANRFQKNTYSVSNTVAYNIYRLNILSVANPGAASCVQLSEIELIGVPPPPPPKVLDSAFDAENSPKVSFHFSRNVKASLGSDDLVLHNSTTNQDITVPAPTYDGPSNTAAFILASLPDGNYTATLKAGGINDAAGSLLDGNADGTAGDNYTMSFFVLAGDANHDRSMGFEDLVAVAQHYGQVGRATASTGDENHDGNVDFADLVVVAQKYGSSLPALPAAAVPALTPELPVVAPVEKPVAVSKPVAKPAPVAAVAKGPVAAHAVVAPSPVAAVAPVSQLKPTFSVVPVAKPSARVPVVVRPGSFNSVQKKRDSFYDDAVS